MGYARERPEKNCVPDASSGRLCRDAGLGPADRQEDSPSPPTPVVAMQRSCFPLDYFRRKRQRDLEGSHSPSPPTPVVAMQRSCFSPDALWRSPSALTVYFKFEETTPTDLSVSKWRREIWNEGFAPLLWVISPERIDLYNGFGTPISEGDAQEHLIQTFENIDG